mmetsp:Transcript_47711/g.102239  ORF Transcript_47711/g.102239 Transcript_47711/m.102239 type:complete len:311 (+) Transcript_47711:808-1740(+)
MAIRAESLPAESRANDFFALSLAPAFSWFMRASASAIFLSCSASFFWSFAALDQSPITVEMRAESPPTAFLSIMALTLSMLLCLYSMSFRCAASISAWNFLWISLSSLLFSRIVCQLEKHMVVSALSWPEARLMRTLFALVFWLILKSRIAASTLSSSEAATSAFPALLERRLMRLSMVLAQEPLSDLNWATSWLASSTTFFRICWQMPASPSSMTLATSASVPSSRDKRMRVTVESTNCTFKRKWLILLLRGTGIFLTSSMVMVSSSIWQSASFSSWERTIPQASKSSNALMRHVSRSQVMAMFAFINR